MTGPLLEENKHVLDIPQEQRKGLTVTLSGKFKTCTMLPVIQYIKNSHKHRKDNTNTNNPYN